MKPKLIWHAAAAYLAVKIALVLLLALVAAVAFFATNANSAEIPVRITNAIDGDTYTVQMPDGRLERVRLAGVDTPEPWPQHADCPAEVPIGEAVSELVRTWIRQAATTKYDVPQSWPIAVLVTDDERDRYGRLLGDLVLDGESLSQRLLDGGHAVTWPHERGVWC